MAKIKLNSLDDNLAEITKKHGKNAIVRLGDSGDQSIERLSTGILALDQALDGGFPLGRMVELYGPEASGKTSISLRAAGQAQEHGRVILLDAENAFDPVMARKSGVDIDNLYMSQPDTAEQAFEILEDIVVTDDVSMIIVDSVAALLPRAELEGDYGDAFVGVMARLMSSGIKKLSRKMQAEESKTILIWINQVREKIGTFGYGPSTTTTGGRALKFYCSTRLDVARTGQVKSGEDIIGHSVKAKVAKSRFSPPSRTANFDILYETGISNESTLLELALASGRFSKAGAWYTDAQTGERLGQGKLAVLDKLRNDDVLVKELLTDIAPKSDLTATDADL